MIENLSSVKYGSGVFEDTDLIKLKNISTDIFESNQKKGANSMLAGNIQHEYVMPSEANKIILPTLSQVARGIIDEKNWKIDALWINYQKKYEFNPLHHHSGVLSFVIWIQIPYNLSDEFSLNSVKNSNRPSPSLFSLVYINPAGVIEQKPIMLDKKDEGKFLVFPSVINHMVYPFYTSDEYRISIAGNMSPRRY